MPAILRILLLILFILLILALGKSRSAEVPSPMAKVKETLEKLKQTVSDPSLKGDSKKETRHARIRELLLERMDFAEMGKRALGASWRKISDSEKAEYLELFAKLVEVQNRRNVFERVEFIESAKIIFLKEIVEPNGEFASVDLKIPSSPEDLSVVFKLHLVSGHWKAYDIVIDGISMVSSWRSQFNRILSKKSFADLLEQLREKIKELDK